MNLSVWKCTPADIKIRVNVDSSKGRDILEVCSGKTVATITRPTGKHEFTVLISESDYVRALDMLKKLREGGVNLDD
jgi:hypothetical protein